MLNDKCSKLCATLKVGDKIEVMFNNAKNKDTKHIPKWFQIGRLKLVIRAPRRQWTVSRGAAAQPTDRVGAGHGSCRRAGPGAEQAGGVDPAVLCVVI
eukprot:SAG22_NODE_1330_length_4709_cov_25.747722_4_plen_98_part_00